jgi:phosphate transport system substrate-binding protein
VGNVVPAGPDCWQLWTPSEPATPAFKASPGEGKTVNWSAGIGGRGNAGVAANVSKIAGAIGYVEYAYAKQSGIAFAQLKNKPGKWVLPSLRSFAAAASGASWQSSNGFGTITSSTPIIMASK